MTSLDRFQVVLLPRRELVISDCTLREALAFQRGYHEAAKSCRHEAVIAVVRAVEGKSAQQRTSQSSPLLQPAGSLRPAKPNPFSVEGQA